MGNQMLLFLLLTSCLTLNSQVNLDTSHYRDFDFWIGEWNVYNKGDDTIRAHSSITRIIDGFGIEENYTVVGGSFTGKSLNTWNPRTKEWEQFWIDNSGNVLKIKGGLDAEGRMIMGNESSNSVGANVVNEMSWTALPGGEVNQVWRAKQGDGDWQVVFDGIYRRKE